MFIGHSDAIPQAVRIFIYLFHMPMFFFCMGYYSSTGGTLGDFVKKRFRQLMVPFFAYGILYHVLFLGILVPLLRGGADWALCRDNILGLLVQMRGTDLVAPKWFLTAAFVASVLFYALRKYVHDRRIEFPAALAVSAAFVYLGKFTGFTLCLALYSALKNVKKKSVLSYIGVNSLLFHLFDNLPEVAVGQAVRMLGVTNVYAVTLCQLAAIILLTPVIVMLVKYFAWFLFGLKKESWSFDYKKLFGCRKKTTA